MRVFWALSALRRLRNVHVHAMVCSNISFFKELLGHSIVLVTMRYTHSNLPSRVAAVEKLGGTAAVSTKMQRQGSGESSKMAANSQNTLELKTEEWVSG